MATRVYGMVSRGSTRIRFVIAPLLVSASLCLLIDRTSEPVTIAAPPPPEDRESLPERKASGDQHVVHEAGSNNNDLAKLQIPRWVGQTTTEPFDVKAFLKSRVAPIDNAAPQYLLAFADLSPEMSSVYPAAEWKKRLPQVQAVAKAIDGAADVDKLRSGDVSPTEVERVLMLARPAIDKLIQAQQKPRCVFAADLQLYDPIPNVQGMRKLSRLGVVELFAARIDGDYERAHQSIARQLRASRDIRPRGSLICQLTSNVADALTLSTITELTLSQPGLTVENCDRLIQLLVSHEATAVNPLEEGLRCEYIIARNTLHAVRDPLRGYRYLVEALGEGDADSVPTREQLARVNWKVELSTCDRIFTTLLSHVEQPQINLPRDWSKDQQEQLKAEGTSLMSILAMNMNSVFEAIRRNRARMAGTIGLSAVRRYQLAHGKLPTELSKALEEAMLPPSLLDPYSGQPMQYVILNDKPVVYSVGSDRIDQRATADWKFGSQPGDFIMTIGE